MRLVLYEDDRVRIGIFDDNEYAIESKIADPTKVRLSVDEHLLDEGNLGTCSLNVRRADSRHEEWATIGGRLTPSGGSLGFAVRRAGEPDVREVLHLDADRIMCNVPIIAPNIGGPGAYFLHEFKHPNGIIWGVMQGDGNLVLYKNRVAFDYATGEPYWSSGTVVHQE